MGTRNPARKPVEEKVVEIPLFTRFQKHPTVGWHWDFWRINSSFTLKKNWAIIVPLLVTVHLGLNLCFVKGDFLTDKLPWDSLPLNSPAFGEYCFNFFFPTTSSAKFKLGVFFVVRKWLATKEGPVVKWQQLTHCFVWDARIMTWGKDSFLIL